MFQRLMLTLFFRSCVFWMIDLLRFMFFRTEFPLKRRCSMGRRILTLLLESSTITLRCSIFFCTFQDVCTLKLAEYDPHWSMRPLMNQSRLVLSLAVYLPTYGSLFLAALTPSFFFQVWYDWFPNAMSQGSYCDAKMQMSRYVFGRSSRMARQRWKATGCSILHAHLLWLLHVRSLLFWRSKMIVPVIV